MTTNGTKDETTDVDHDGEDSARMTFTEHLGELRTRMVRTAMAVMVGFFVAFAYREPLFLFLAEPIRTALAEYGIYNLRAIEITETIFVYLKLSLVAGVIGTLPFSFYQMWAFIAPGLLEREKQAIAPLIFFSTFFFLLGTFFAYTVIIPFIAQYLAELTVGTSGVAMDVTVQSAFSFSLKLIVAFGVAFELPLVMFFLSVLGLVDHTRYIRFFRYFVVLSFIIAAIFTPPDPLSQLLMAVPLNVLYWVGVLASAAIGKRKKGPRSLVVPSRVWAALSLCLLAVGGAIGGATWYLGQSHSPLRWIPPNATWVTSIKMDNTLGADVSTNRKDLLASVLAIDTTISKADRVLRVGGPDGKQFTIYAGGCAQTTPATGTCAGSDLLVGDEALISEAIQAEGALLDSPILYQLELSGPMWAWDREAGQHWTDWLPGSAEETLAFSSLSLVADLRGDDPWLTIRFRLDSSGELTTLQNRIEGWRIENNRRKELAQQKAALSQEQGELLRLVQALSTLTNDRIQALSEEGVEAPELAARHTALHAQLSERMTGLRAAEPLSAELEAASLFDRLGADAIRSWRTSLEGDELSLHIHLTQPSGVDTFLRLLPDNAH